LKKSDHGLIKAIAWSFLEGLQKTQKNISSNSQYPRQDSTKHLLNTGLECYNYAYLCGAAHILVNTSWTATAWWEGKGQHAFLVSIHYYGNE